MIVSMSGVLHVGQIPGLCLLCLRKQHVLHRAERACQAFASACAGVCSIWTPGLEDIFVHNQGFARTAMFLQHQAAPASCIGCAQLSMDVTKVE